MSAGAGDDVKQVTTAVDSEEVEVNNGPPSYKLLSEGLMTSIIPKIRSVQKKAGEIAKSQEVMVESLQEENEKVSEWDMNNEILTYMAEVKHYRAKLLKIRRDMIALSEKSKKMKQKAQQLQHQKEKEELKQQALRHSQEELEKHLTAKPATKPSSSE